MTPTEHLAEAERLLDEARNPTSPWSPDWVLAKALEAVAHALVAIGAEFGVPHQHLPAGGDVSGNPAGNV